MAAVSVPHHSRVGRWLDDQHVLARLILAWCMVIEAVMGVASGYLGDVRFAKAWALFSFAGSLSCAVALAASHHPGLCRKATAVAGAATVTAFSARAAVVVWSYCAGTLDHVSGWRVVLTAAAFVSLALFAAIMWFRGLLKLPSHRHGG